MSDFIIEATIRNELGKNANRRLRQEGKIPAVVYGKGSEGTSLVVDPKEVLRVFQSESGYNTIVSLTFEGQTVNALIRDFQVDPVKSNLLHVDFQKILMDEVMNFEVPIELVGTAVGVTAGGVQDITLRAVEVECLPTDVPDHFTLDVSELEIGDALHVSDLEVDSKITILAEPEQVVTHVLPPKISAEDLAADEEEAAAAAEAAAEPEVIGKGKDEDSEQSGETTS